MSVDIRSNDRRRYIEELEAREQEIAAGLLKASQPASPKAVQENEKRIRREIANSNERRRMQCINAGFSNLRSLIPQLEGEKLSKAAILQHTTEYIAALEKDKSRLQMQLDHSKRLLTELGQDRMVTDAYVSNSPPPTKRKKRDTESSDEGVGSLSDTSDDGGSELRNENIALRRQLEAERQRYTTVEERCRLLESQLLSLLQGPGAIGEMRQVAMEPLPLPQQQPETFYNREVVEVIASREVMPPSPVEGAFQPPRPMSPTPERGIPMETSIDTPAPRSASLLESTLYYPGSRDTVSPAVKMEVIPSRESNTPILNPVRESLSRSSEVVVPAPVAPSSTIDQHNYHHHHNYCHRDHPRRRHRQQAILDQQREEEELRLQQQQQQQQQQADVVTLAAGLYRPKQNTQNLENLVEAIRQIEGDRVLCDERKLYEEEHKMYDKRQSFTSEESERETSSVSDQEDKSEHSGRDSPLHHRHHHLLQQQSEKYSVTSSYQLTPQVSVTLPNNTSSNISSTYSEKYPIATHLLHRPLPPIYLHDVILPKQ